MTRADELESLFLVKQELETMRIDNQSLAEELLSSHTRCEHLEQEIIVRDEKLAESFKAREEAEKTVKAKTKEIENLKKKIKEMANSSALNVDIDGDLKNILIDEEVGNIRKENEETRKDLQVLKEKVFNLKHIWKAHIQRNSDQESSGRGVASAPKKLISSLYGSSGGTAKLEEELISVRLSEVDCLARLQESQSLIRDLEHQVKSSRHQLSRQDALVTRLQDELDHQKRKQTELQGCLRESEIKMVNLEGKLKDERLMSRISEAENSQLVAELRQQIANMQISKEIKALDNIVILEDVKDESEEEET